MYLDKIDPYSKSIISDSLIPITGKAEVLSRKMKYFEDTLITPYQEINKSLARFIEKGYLNDEIKTAFSSFLEMRNSYNFNMDKTKFNVFFGNPRKKKWILIDSKKYDLKIISKNDLKKNKSFKEINLNGITVYKTKNAIYFIF